MKYLPIILILLFASCSPQAKFRRLVKNNPDLVKVNIITKLDTTFIPGVSVDSVVVGWIGPDASSPTDTAYIYRDRVRVELVKVKDSIKVYAECLPDTIIKEIVTEVNTQVDASRPPLPRWAFVVLAFLAVLVLIRFLK